LAKTVFITGASSGIGAALALELASRGYAPVLRVVPTAWLVRGTPARNTADRS
jgi:NAD(P)-dependent dehydrogenase (short-subunit alcohol dehydrogenase family)